LKTLLPEGGGEKTNPSHQLTPGSNRTGIVKGENSREEFEPQREKREEFGKSGGVEERPSPNTLWKGGGGKLINPRGCPEKKKGGSGSFKERGEKGISMPTGAERARTNSSSLGGEKKKKKRDKSFTFG